MNYYQEITLIDGDKKLYEIWSDVFNQVHIALADIKNKHSIDSIGISLPSYRYEEKNGKTFAALGDKLRVFAPRQADLEKLNLNHWLSRLTDYVHIKSIAEVGNKATGYLVVKRYRFKPIEVQANSLAEKLGIGYDEAMSIVAKRRSELKVPYFNLKSETNNVSYRLSILQQPVDSPTDGIFNTYGLNTMSTEVTVPHW